MGETPGCPYKGNVQLEYGACDVKCGKYIFLLIVQSIVPILVLCVVALEVSGVVKSVVRYWIQCTIIGVVSNVVSSVVSSKVPYTHSFSTFPILSVLT